MSASLSIAELRVDDLLARIGGPAVSPGAGVAGAVALALAAACASKAVSVSLKHHPADRELQSARDAFQRIASAALNDADLDAEAFAVLIHSKGRGAIDQVVSETERLKRLIGALTGAIDEVAVKIRPNMIGDVVAARALAAAAKRIQERNEGEALQLR